MTDDPNTSDEWEKRLFFIIKKRLSSEIVSAYFPNVFLYKVKFTKSSGCLLPAMSDTETDMSITH